MKARTLAAIVVFIGATGAGGYGLYWLGMSRGMQSAAPRSDLPQPNSQAARKPGDVDPSTGKKVLYWHDPMVPGQKFDKPGKSPFMDMQLVPVYAGGDGGEGAVTISPRLQQSLGVRTAKVNKGTLSPRVEAVGIVAYNERDVALVQARTNGYVEKLYVRAPLDPVKKGQTLAELYAPEWVAAQEDYLTVKRMSGTNPDIESLIGGARQRMRLVGMSEDQIRLVESTGKVHPRLAVTAPIGGLIAEHGTREGMTVMSGAALFRINGLSTVWVNAEVPESESGFVRPGSLIEARTTAFPDMVLKGRVSAILPEVNAATRTLKARVELANPGGRLVPGMFARIDFSPTRPTEVLLVPTEAVIQTGARTVVIVAQNDGRFVPANVEIGIEANGKSEIRKGLQIGQKVVVSGQFLLDSEASLKGTETRMTEMPAAEGGKASDAIHHGVGKIENISADEVTLSHEPIPSLQWGRMTMGFKLPANKAPKGLRVGDNVKFGIRQTRDGAFEITSMSPVDSPATESGKGGVMGSKK